MTALLTGLLTGWAMIIAIGAQNAFVLRQGLVKSHVAMIVTTCILSDLLLIGVSVAGLGAVVGSHPVLTEIIRWVGVTFLSIYAVISFRRAWRPKGLVATTGPAAGGAGATAGKMLALTWLNPHLFLDIAVLGSIASQQGSTAKWWFAVGAGLASTTWFALLGYGSRALRPLLARPGAWRVLDVVIGVVMAGIAIQLGFGS